MGHEEGNMTNRWKLPSEESQFLDIPPHLKRDYMGIDEFFNLIDQDNDRVDSSDDYDEIMGALRSDRRKLYTHFKKSVGSLLEEKLGKQKTYDKGYYNPVGMDNYSGDSAYGSGSAGDSAGSGYRNRNEAQGYSSSSICTSPKRGFSHGSMSGSSLGSIAGSSHGSTQSLSPESYRQGIATGSKSVIDFNRHSNYRRRVDVTCDPVPASQSHKCCCDSKCSEKIENRITQDSASEKSGYQSKTCDAENQTGSYYEHNSDRSVSPESIYSDDSSMYLSEYSPGNERLPESFPLRKMTLSSSDESKASSGKSSDQGVRSSSSNEPKSSSSNELKSSSLSESKSSSSNESKEGSPDEVKSNLSNGSESSSSESKFSPPHEMESTSSNDYGSGFSESSLPKSSVDSLTTGSSTDARVQDNSASSAGTDQPKRKRRGGKIGRKRKRGYIYNPKPLMHREKIALHQTANKNDAEYLIRRQRNNEASKRSRESRREKEIEIIQSAKMLEIKNAELREKIRELEEKNKSLETMLHNEKMDKDKKV